MPRFVIIHVATNNALKTSHRIKPETESVCRQQASQSFQQEPKMNHPDYLSPAFPQGVREGLLSQELLVAFVVFLVGLAKWPFPVQPKTNRCCLLQRIPTNFNSPHL
jgi:hypothetical protein